MLLVAEDANAIRLDPGLLKTLASDTRREILRALRARRMTVSELSKQLGVGKPTVLEHVRKLDAAGLVRRIDDDRLWVYYELTDLGTKMSGTGSVSVFLVLGISIAVIALGLMLVLGVMQFVGTVPLDGDDAAFDVQVAQDGVFAQARDGFVVRLEGDEPLEPGDWFARFEPADRQTASVAGVVRGAPAGNGTLVFEAPERLDSGLYTLRVTSPSGNAGTASEPVQVHTMQLATTAPRWWQMIDGPAQVRVWVDGLPANGTLVATHGDDETVAFDLRDGAATLDPAILDTLTPGPLHLGFVPASADLTVDRGDQMQILDPRIEIAPLRVVGESEAATTLLFAGHLEAPASFPVRVDGNEVQPTARGPGLFQVSLSVADGQPASDDDGTRVGTRTATIEVGRAPPVAVDVVPKLQLTLRMQQDAEDALVVRDAGGAAVDVTVRLDGALVGDTDSNGTIHLGHLANGTHNIGIVLDDGTVLQRAVHVQGDDATPSVAAVRVADVRFQTNGTDASMSFTLDNDDLRPVNVTVVGVGNDGLTLARSLLLGATAASHHNATGLHLLDTDRLELHTVEEFDLQVEVSSGDDATSGGSGGTGGSGGSGGAPQPSASPTATATATASPTPSNDFVAHYAPDNMFGQQLDTRDVDAPRPPPTVPGPGDADEDAAYDDEATPAPPVGLLLAALLLGGAWVARRRRSSR